MPAARTPTSAPAATATAPAHSPEQAVLRLHRGIDVSVHSGVVDWTKVAAAGHGFAILKATEGVDLADSAFHSHWREAAAAGLVRGAYHFYVTEDAPEQQAAFFIATVQLQPGDLAPIVDIEWVGHHTADGWQDSLLVFIRRLQDHYGVAPIIYTSPHFWSDHFKGKISEELAPYPLWIAEYDVPQPTVPATWSTWHMWQYQGDAAIAGVEKSADLSQVNRDGVNPAVLVIPRPLPPVPEPDP